MDKRAFFVIGVEGSGTNMLAEAFVSAGCHEDPRHRSYMKDYEFEKMPDLLMFRRSFPHRGTWPDVHEAIRQLRRAYYTVHVIGIVRDLTITYLSVMKRDTNRAPLHLTLGVNKFHRKFAALGEKSFLWRTLISYGTFCLDPEYRRWLFVERLGLKEPMTEIKYANPKYYRELAGI